MKFKKAKNLYLLLKWYCEYERPFKIISAGSLLGVKLKRFHSSFPVGKVEMINMFPMDFQEFLMPQSNGEYIIEYIKKCFEENSPMNQVTHEKLIELYRKY